MENTFRSIHTTKLQKVFARAHYLAHQDPTVPASARRQFHEIARMLWDACGEDQPMPSILPTELEMLGAPKVFASKVAR